MEDRGGTGEEEMVIAVDLVIYLSKTLSLMNIINVCFCWRKKKLSGVHVFVVYVAVCSGNLNADPHIHKASLSTETFT